jgi:hypothetical protein
MGKSRGRVEVEPRLDLGLRIIYFPIRSITAPHLQHYKVSPDETLHRASIWPVFQNIKPF